MSRAHHYHQPHTPEASEEDQESDLELDLRELGPTGPLDEISYENTRSKRRGDGAPQPDGQIPLRKLRLGGLRVSGRRTRRLDGVTSDESRRPNTEHFLLNEDADNGDHSEGFNNFEDGTPLLQHHGQEQSPGHGRTFRWLLRFPRFLSSRTGRNSTFEVGTASQIEPQPVGSPRSISIGQFPSPRYPPNAVSNAKYNPWSFLPRTLYNEFSFFINLYFLFVALSQIIPPLRIGYLSTYIAPLAFVLTVTLGKEALDDIARRRRDSEANKEEYAVLRLRDTSKSSGVKTKAKETALAKRKANGKRVQSAGERRMEAIEEEEENIDHGFSSKSHIEVVDVRVRSRDLKVGDILKLGKDQRVPADLIILKSYTTESSVISFMDNAKSKDQDSLLVEPMLDASSLGIDVISDSSQANPTMEHMRPTDRKEVGETFIRTDQLDGETDWKLRLASPLTQSLDPQDFLRITIAAGRPDKKINEFVGTVELAPVMRSQAPHNDRAGGSSQAQDQKVMTAPLTVDNTAWANTVLASSATVLAVVVYTGPQTRQALSTSSSRSKIGLLEFEINNLTKILCALTLTLSILLVALQNFKHGQEPIREDQKWYITITRFLILFSTIIPISLRVNLDMGKTVYAWFIERDRDMPGAVVRTSTIPEDLGRIEYLLSDKTGTLTQNGKSYNDDSNGHY